jgi:hypothetical protein
MGESLAGVVSASDRKSTANSGAAFHTVDRTREVCRRHVTSPFISYRWKTERLTVESRQSDLPEKVESRS